MSGLFSLAPQHVALTFLALASRVRRVAAKTWSRLFYSRAAHPLPCICGLLVLATVAGRTATGTTDA